MANAENTTGAHTPGPWAVKQYRYSRSREYMLDAGGVHLADIYGEANAALIAKAPIAPKLAEALREIETIERAYRGVHGHPELDKYATLMVKIARAALALWDAQ